RLSKEARIQEEEEADELYREVDINQGRGLQLSQNIKDFHVTLTPVHPDGLQESSSVDAPIPPTTIPSTILKNLPTFNSVFRFDERLRSLETTFSEYRQTNPFVDAVSVIPGIVHQYMTQQMMEAIREAVQIQTDQIQDSLQRENDEFLRNINENIKKIIMGQVKSQVKEQVLRILPRIEESVNATVEAKVLTRSSHSSRTSYAIAADLSEMELKKILIEMMEGNKFIQRSDEQQNLYKAEDERMMIRKDPPLDQTGGLNDKENKGSMHQLALHLKQRPGVQADLPQGLNLDNCLPHPEWFSMLRRPPSPDRDWNKTLLAAQGDAQSWISKLARGSCNSLTELEYHLEEVYKATTDQLDWVNPEGQQYPHNLLQPLPLIPNNRGRRVIPFEHFTNNDLEYLLGGASSRKYTKFEPINYDRHALWGVSHWGRKRQQFYGFAVNRESALNVYSKRRIIAITELKIVEWYNDKHLDWILVPRDDDKIYKFKEGDFKRLRLQDIEDMLLLLVQGKLSNLTVEEHFPFNVSLRMFTRSIVIQRRVEDLQLGVKSYQKRLNLTKPDTYRPDLKRRKAYTTYSNPRGFIYQNKDKKHIDADR
nr:hypothetical protein [Tanacetum cinerariifolium]